MAQLDRLAREAAADGPMGGRQDIMSFAIHPFHHAACRTASTSWSECWTGCSNDRMFCSGREFQIHDWYLTTGDPS